MKSDTRNSKIFFRNTLALGTILAFRGKLSPFGFNQQLNMLLDQKGELRGVKLNDPELLTGKSLLRQHLLLQLSSEHIASANAIERRIDRQPREAQLMFDTLFYLPDLIGVSSPAKYGAMTVEVNRRWLKSFLLARASSETADLPSDFLPNEMLDWLFGLVRAQILILDNPALLKPNAETERAPTDPEGYEDWQQMKELRNLFETEDRLVRFDRETEDALYVALLVDAFAMPREQSPGYYDQLNAPEMRLVEQVRDLQRWEVALETLMGVGQAHEAQSQFARLGALHVAPSWERIRDRFSTLRVGASGDSWLPMNNLTADDLRPFISDFGSYLSKLFAYRHVFDRVVRSICLAGAGAMAAGSAANPFAARARALDRLGRMVGRDPDTMDAAMTALMRDRAQWDGTGFQDLLQRPPGLSSGLAADWFEFLLETAAHPGMQPTDDSREEFLRSDEKYWLQWGWEMEQAEVPRDAGPSLLDLVYMTRHPNAEDLGTQPLPPRLGLWSRLWRRAISSPGTLPQAAFIRVRRDLGLDNPDGTVPLLVVVPLSDESDMLGWALPQKFPIYLAPTRSGPDELAALLELPFGPASPETAGSAAVVRSWILVVERREGEKPASPFMARKGGTSWAGQAPGAILVFGGDRSKLPPGMVQIEVPKSADALRAVGMDILAMADLSPPAAPRAKSPKRRTPPAPSS